MIAPPAGIAVTAAGMWIMLVRLTFMVVLWGAVQSPPFIVNDTGEAVLPWGVNRIWTFMIAPPAGIAVAAAGMWIMLVRQTFMAALWHVIW
jgi:hypothetical protein